MSAKASGFDGAFAGTQQEIEGALTRTARQVTEGLKAEVRAEVIAAGLGAKLANTWRGKTYPATGSSLDPSTFVWSKAPKLIDAFSRNLVILPGSGRRYRAIPTENVPMKARGRQMSPLDVETSFNQDLIIRPGRNGTKLGFVNVLAAKNKRGFRRPTKGRLAQGRTAKLVLMFVFVRSTRHRKRLDPAAIGERWAGKYQSILNANWR